MSRYVWQSLAASLGQLLRTWWGQDRIRVSSTCGQLLSLAVGDRLLIGEHIFVVADRLNGEEKHATRNNGHSVSTHDSAGVGGADEQTHVSEIVDTELFDGDSQTGVSTYVEYLLDTYDDEDRTTWYPLEDENSIAFSEETLGQVARLIVPIVGQNAICFQLGQSCRELLHEEIVILPGK